MGLIPWDGMIEKGERRGRTKRANEEDGRRGWTILVRGGVDDARVRLEGHTLASPSDVQSSGYEKTMVVVVITVENIKA